MTTKPPTIPRKTGLSDQSYVAFISYRHADNQREGRQWASWLHHTLETYEVPEDIVGTKNLRGENIPSRLFPVFRDEEELPADADLSTPIVHALEKSQYLVVLCSPGAVASRFVADEIARFKAMGKESRVIAAILSGEPNASNDPAKQSDGHSPQSECFPEPLRFEVEKDGTISGREAEPLAADFRLPDGSEGWSSPEPYRNFLTDSGLSKAEVEKKVSDYSSRLDMMKLKIIAGIIGVPLGVLTKRDKAYQLEKAKKRARVLRLWLTATALLACAAIAAGVIAWNKQREAEARKAEVIETLANSDFQQGTRALESDETTPRGMALLARAVREGRDPRAATRLWTLLQQRSFWIPISVEKTDPPLTLPTKEDESAEDPMAAIPAYLRETYAQVERDGERIEVKRIVTSPDGRKIATIVGDVVTGTDAALRVWDENGKPITEWFAPTYEGNHYLYGLQAEFSPDGRFLAVIAVPWREPQYVEVYDLQTKKRVGDPVTATGEFPLHQFAPFTKVTFLTPEAAREDGYELFLLTASGRGDASIHAILPEYGEMWELATNHHPASITEAVVDPSIEWLMSSSDDGEIHVSSISRREAIGNLIAMEHPASRMERIDDRRLSVTLQTGETHTFELRPPHRAPLPEGVLVSPDSKSLSVDWSESEDNKVEGTVVATHPTTGVDLLRLSARQIGLRNGNDPIGPVTSSIVFPSDLSLVSSDESGKFLMTTRSDFVTEIWTSDFASRIGPPLIERHHFDEGKTPEEPTRVMFYPSRYLALTESHLFQPPNFSQYWYCLWDTKSGLLLMDRTELDDDILSEDQIVRIRFDRSNQYLLFLTRMEEGQSEPSYSPKFGIQISPSSTTTQILPDLAEAIAGNSINREGITEPILNRISKLQELFSALKNSP